MRQNDIFLTFSIHNNEVYLNDLVKYLVKDIPEDMINTGILYDLKLERLYEILTDMGIIENNYYQYPKTDTIKIEYKLINNLRKKDLLKKDIINSYFQSISKKLLEKSDLLKYILSQEDMQKFIENITKIRKYLLYHTKIIDNVYLKDIIDNYKDNIIMGYDLSIIGSNLKKIFKYLNDTDIEKEKVEYILKKYEIIKMYYVFLATDNKMIDKIKQNLNSSYINRIIKGIPKNFNSYEQAYYLYKTVCEHFIYDSKFYASNQIFKLERKNHLLFEDISKKDEVNNELICYDASIILSTLLEKIGYLTKIINKTDEISKLNKKGHHSVVAFNGKYFLKLDVTGSPTFDLVLQKINNEVGNFITLYSNENITEYQKKVDTYFQDNYQTSKNIQKELNEYKLKFKQEMSFKEVLDGIIYFFKNSNYDNFFLFSYYIYLKDIIFNNREYLKDSIEVVFVGYLESKSTYNMSAVIVYNEYGIDKENGVNNNYLLLKDCKDLQSISYINLQNMVDNEVINLFNKGIPGIKDDIYRYCL